MPPFPKTISENFKDFLTGIFQYDPDSRPSVLELLAHPLIKGNSKSHIQFVELDLDNDTSQLIDMDYNEIKLSDKIRSPPVGGTKRSQTFDPYVASMKKTEIAPKRVQLIESSTNNTYSSPKKTEENKQSYGNLVN